MDNRIFGLDPQLLLDAGFTLLAVFILFLALSYLLFNPAREMLEKRKKYIASQLEEAADAKKDALGLKEEYDGKLAHVEEESAELMVQARKHARARENEIIAEAGVEAQRLKDRAEKEVALEKDKVRDEMRQEMVQVATLMAGKFVSESMDEKTQADLIDATLKEMGDDTWQN